MKNLVGFWHLENKKADAAGATMKPKAVLKTNLDVTKQTSEIGKEIILQKQLSVVRLYIRYLVYSSLSAP